MARSSRKGRGKVSLLFLDIDHFKMYNDTYGHTNGDRLLRELACLLMQELRSEDTICRYGGEEFTALAVDTDHKGAYKLGGRLREKVEAMEVHPEGYGPTGITVSIGCATYPNYAVSVNEFRQDPKAAAGKLIDAADTAMYYSKNHGRNRVSSYTRRLSGLVVPHR